MADMTAREWAELDRLARKAAYTESTSESSRQVLMSVSAYASRMAH